MLGNKYFYYLFLMNGLINVISYVPRVLIYTRFQGALLSVFISVLVSSVLIYLFARQLRRFEGQGLPEMLNAAVPKWIKAMILLSYSIIFFGAGTIMMWSFVDITMRYISPDISPYAVIISFLLVVGTCCRLDSASIMYGLETLLLLITPLILFMLVKALLNSQMNWDSVMQVITYTWTTPKYISIAGGTFVFSGYVNMCIFNRAFKQFRPRFLWTIPVSGLLILLITFLVPIGYQGTIGVGTHVYNWFSTADSIRIELFVIERVLFLFYTIYLTLFLISSIVHWHVGLELFKGIFQRKKGTLPGKKADYWILAPFILLTIILMNYLNQVRLTQLGQWFLNIRLPAEFLLLAILIYVNRRRAVQR